MPQSLRDPIWQFVGALLTAATIAIMFLLFLLERKQKRKALSYRIESRTRLLTVDESIKGRLQILFDGSPVSDAQLLLILVFNSGTVPIPATDYIEPIQFKFADNAKILSAAVIYQKPKNLGGSVSVDEDSRTLSFKPLLMNKGDEIGFKVILSSSSDRIHVEARIVGVSQITARPYQRQMLVYLAMVSLLFALLTAVPVVFGFHTVLLIASIAFLSIALFSVVGAWLWAKRPVPPFHND